MKSLRYLAVLPLMAATAQALQATRKSQGTRRYRNKEQLIKDLGL